MCLLHKHEDQFDPQKLHKAESTVLGGLTEGVLQLTDCLAKSVSSRYKERPCLKERSGWGNGSVIKVIAV